MQIGKTNWNMRRDDEKKPPEINSPCKKDKTETNYKQKNEIVFQFTCWLGVPKSVGSYTRAACFFFFFFWKIRYNTWKIQKGKENEIMHN